MKWLRNRKANRKREAVEPLNWQRPARVVIGLALMGGVAWLVHAYLAQSDWERFHTLEVTGEMSRIDVREVQALLAPYLESGFAQIDIREAQRALEAHQWVAAAGVRRKWPGTLVVELDEEKPVATWFGTSLLNAQGKVFVDGATGYSGVLPDIGGPMGAQMEMIQRLAEISSHLDVRGLNVRRIVKSDRRAERFWLENGIEIRLGRRDTEHRLNRFLHTAWPALEAQADKISYIDMRYTNGFAVGWKNSKNEGGQAPGDRSNVQENG